MSPTIVLRRSLGGIQAFERQYQRTASPDCIASDGTRDRRNHDHHHAPAVDKQGDLLEAVVIRLGLCCIFREQPIKFATTTATSTARLPRDEQLRKLSRLSLQNADALLSALRYCAVNHIGCFRINSQILPLKTHPECGYQVAELPDGQEIVTRFMQCGEFAKKHGLRTCFHPDQFVVLNSTRADVVDKSLLELEYQSEVAGWVGADVVNTHAGGAFGDKRTALETFARNLDRLSASARALLTVENDDKLFAPEDVLPICRAAGIPLVYDVHHHRCHADDLSVEEATRASIETWNREPMFHISSPLEGWNGPRPERHHDYIDVQDFPECWRRLKITVEVEAKAKELAIEKLRRDLKA
jgi:UV DNA damage endonuclease